MKYGIIRSNLKKTERTENRKRNRIGDPNESSLLDLIRDNSGFLSFAAIVIGMFAFIFAMKSCEQNTSVDAYLSKYDFEKARKAAQDLPDGPTSMWDGNVTNHNFEESDKAKALFLIIGQEAAFYIQQKQYEKALQAAGEIHSLFSGYEATPDPDQSYDDIVNKIVDGLIRDSNYDFAKKISVSFKSYQERESALERIKQSESQK